MPDRPANQPAVHIEFLEFFVFLVFAFTSFYTWYYFYAIRLMLSPSLCASACAYSVFLDLMKTTWDSDVAIFFQIARNNTEHNLQEFDTNLITYSKMAVYNSVYNSEYIVDFG